MHLERMDAFRRHLDQSPPPRLCLIVGEEHEEGARLLRKAWKAPILTLEPEDFSPERFSREVETLPFLTQSVYLHLRHVERLKAQEGEVITAFLQNPTPWVSLLLSGASLPPKHAFFKGMEERGMVVRLPKEKPWEKERHLAHWLMEEAIKEGTRMTTSAASALIHTLGEERELLRRELDKLICYVGHRHEITPQDVALLSSPISHKTLWGLGDALLAHQTTTALSIGRAILQEGTSLFPLLAHLRTQMRTGLQILLHFQQGGEQKVKEAYPYLKGKLLERKIAQVRRCGIQSLKGALEAIFETEIQARSSAADPQLLLERLIVYLTHATALAS